jgi:YHS domain-containing protein
MLKRISRIGFIASFAIAMAVLCGSGTLRAGTYKLEYPQGYGCNCIPNAREFGYFHTAWREWPCEIRRDKTFPRSIGMETLPTPEGQEIIPPPKLPTPAHVPGEALPGEGGLPPEGMPAQETPGEKPTEEGQAPPILPRPGLPQEPGGFNPVPSLPPDLGMPTPLLPKEQKEGTPATEPNEQNPPKEEPAEKEKTENPAPGAKTHDKGARRGTPNYSRTANRISAAKQLQTANAKAAGPVILQPNVDADAVRAQPQDYPSIARGITYHETAQTAARPLPRDVVAQSYQQPTSSPRAQADVSAGLQQDASGAQAGPVLPKVALDGFCPVELCLHGRWAQGDARFSAVYKGSIYRFSGNSQRQEFLANPEQYVPFNGGFDPVVSTTEKRNVPGQLNYCAAYKGRIYMFSSATSQASFHKNPELYISATTK